MFQGFITLHKVIAEGKNAIFFFFRFYMFIKKKTTLKLKFRLSDKN